MNQATFTTDTAPVARKGLPGLKWRVRGALSSCLLPIMQRGGRSYVGGETVGDALSVARRLADEGMPTTLAFWDLEGADPRRVADAYLVGIQQIAESGLDSYLSIKPPALAFSTELTTEVAIAAQQHGVRLHCDSHAVEVAEPSCAMMTTMALHLSSDKISSTLPGRWTRSLTDADWCSQRGFPVRVVKGQWADPEDATRDMREGFLELIDRLAGQSPLVAVATHDVPLAAEAIKRLRTAGTPCERELLFGMPIKQSIAWCKENDVPVRIYIPYGPGYLPYAIDQLLRNPRIVVTMIRGLLPF
jgi:proline dehydrogenase